MDVMDCISEESLSDRSPLALDSSDQGTLASHCTASSCDVAAASSTSSTRATRIASYQQMRQHSMARPVYNPLALRSVSCDASDVTDGRRVGSVDSDVFSESPTVRHMRYVSNYARRRGLRGGKLPTSYR